MASAESHLSGWKPRSKQTVLIAALEALRHPKSLAVTQDYVSCPSQAYSGDGT
jgi:hypothetical protein